MADVNFVNSLYRNVLAREPDAAGVDFWVRQIAGGANHDQVRAGFLNLAETQTIINPVIRLYEGLLNRAPDADGLKFWADAMRAGKSLNDITNDIMHSPEGTTNGFGDDVDDATFVNNLYLRIGRDQAQIDADPDGVAFWLNALNNTSRATVAQSMLESPENLQNSAGFVTGYTALRAAGNPGPTTAQLNAFSDTATTAQIIASADAVGDSTTIRPTGPGATPYDLTNTAENLAAVEAWELNGATNITATTPATVAQAAIIEAAANSGETFYDLHDTANDIWAAEQAILDGASNITATTPVSVAVATKIETSQNDNDTYDLSDTAANLADAAINGMGTSFGLGGATNIIATGNATVAQATTIEAATNTGTTTYSISDTAAHLLTATSAVLNGATNIIAGDPVTLALATTIEAANNGGTNTYNISDTPANLAASTNGALALAGTVTASVAATAAEAATLAAFAKPVVYNVSDSAANLFGHSGAALNEAVALTATGDATVAQATTIDAATNTGATTYDINDTGANLALAIPAVLDHATGIDAIGDAVTLTDAQVTGSIIGKFDSADRLTLNAALGTTLSNLSATTLTDLRVLALNATNDTVTLTDGQVTNAIIAKFDPTDDLTLHALGTTVAALWGTTLADADVVAIDVTGDNQVALYDSIGDSKITESIINKFAFDDRLELNADLGTTLSALSAATLGSAKVAVLDAIDNQVTLTDGKVTSTIVDKFVDPDDHLTLNAPGATLGNLSPETLSRSNMTLDAADNAITLTAVQFEQLDIGTSSIAATDAVTINSNALGNALDLDGAGGGAVTVVFDALNDGLDDIAHFDVLTDFLHFSKTAFNAADLPAAGVAIDTTQFFVATDVTGSGTEGTADTRFLYNNGSGTNTGDLFYDANGNVAGGVEHIATMQTVPALTADDIIMIA